MCPALFWLFLSKKPKQTFCVLAKKGNVDLSNIECLNFGQRTIYQCSIFCWQIFIIKKQVRLVYSCFSVFHLIDCILNSVQNSLIVIILFWNLCKKFALLDLIKHFWIIIIKFLSTWRLFFFIQGLDFTQWAYIIQNVLYIFSLILEKSF